MAFTCKPVGTGKVGRRYLCTDGTKAWLTGGEYKYEGKLAREVYPTNAIDTKPTDGIIKEGGWGGNQDANTWRVVNMTKKPELFKVVDDNGKNIITDFKTELDAQKYIDYHLFVEAGGGGGGTTSPPESPSPSPEPGPGGEQPAPAPVPPAAEGTTVTGPYPSIGKELGHKIRRAIRHYASGKPDDETIEANVKNIEARNHQFVCYVTMHEIEHDDTVSVKFGGTHMGSGWFDHTISFEQGQCKLGVEEQHPDYEPIKTGPKIGSILEKKLGIAGVYFADSNHSELWADFPAGAGWKKMMEGKDVGGFNPGAKTFEAQLRIDGFTKGSDPTIHTAVVQPIAPKT